MAIELRYRQQYVFVKFTAHGMVDGDIFQVRGADALEFNGYFTVHYIDANNFAYFVGELSYNDEIDVGTIEMRKFTQSEFIGFFYAGIGPNDLFQDRLSGEVLYMDPERYMDVYITVTPSAVENVPIFLRMRSSNLDAQIPDRKFFDEVMLVSDKYNGIAYIRYSDDDYTSWSVMLPLNTNLNATKARRLGASYRRAFEIQHSENTPFRAEALDILAEKGVQ